LLAKHITSCENVFLKGYFLLATYRVFCSDQNNLSLIRFLQTSSWGKVPWPG
jgi:hypothetical protein